MAQDITELLQAIEGGDSLSAELLLPLVYDQLRRLASERMVRELPGQTLEPTALVHEAYVRLVGGGAGQKWENRRHFFGAAAEAMRRILIESARRKHSIKHGGGLVRHELVESDALIQPGDHATLLALDEALTKLSKVDADLARVVELRFFAGLSVDDTAQVLGVSPRTVKRDWSYARAWLRREMDRT